MASGSHNPPHPPSSDPIPLQDLSSSPSSRLAAFDSGGGGPSHSHGAPLGPSSHRRRRSTHDRFADNPSAAATATTTSSAALTAAAPPPPPPPPPPQPHLVPDLHVPQYIDCDSDVPTRSQLREEVDSALGSHTGRGSWLPPRNVPDPTAVPSRRLGRASHNDGHYYSYGGGDDDDDDDDDGGGGDDGYFYDNGYDGERRRSSSGAGAGGDSTAGSSEDDAAPLTNIANQQPMAGFQPPPAAVATTSAAASAEDRRLKRSSQYGPGPSLGGDLHSAAEEGLARSSSKASGAGSRHGSLARSLSRSGSLLTPGSSPVRRVSVALQNMSQRVVNLSNDPEAAEQATRRRGSSKPPPAAAAAAITAATTAATATALASAAHKGRPSVTESSPLNERDELQQEEKPTAPLRKSSRRDKVPWRDQANPLKGNSLRLFSPSSRVRLVLCDVLIHP